MITRHAAPLRAQVVEAVRSAIVAGEFAPGDRLKENDLCEKFAVSRTVIRETLRQLESERLIHIEPQVGPTVSSLTFSEAKSLYQVRAALEATMAKLATENGTAAQIALISELYEQIVVADTLPLKDLVHLKNQFYKGMAEAAGNPVIEEILGNVQARISQLRRITLKSPNRHEQMVNELGRVIQAIASGDADRAYDASVAHVEAAEAIALKTLSTV